MMYGHEKSDFVIVAVKPTNKAERSAAEPVEPRTGTKGNAGQQSTRQTQSWARVSQALDRIRQLEPSVRFAVTHPRWEPMPEIGTFGCVSSEGWCVQREINPPGQQSGAP